MNRLTLRSRLVLGVMLAAGAQISSVALLLTSGWLVVRAAEHPPVLYLLVAVTSVRMFGVARAVLRYAERLVTHDVALEQGVRTRVSVYRALHAAAPRGIAGQQHGELVASVVSDVERVQDRLLRIRLPWISAIVTCAVVIAVVYSLLAPAAVVLAIQCLLVIVGLGLPLGSDRTTRRIPQERLSGPITELARTAPDLLAYGCSAGRVPMAAGAIAEVDLHNRRGAWLQGAGTAFVLWISAASVLLVALITSAASVQPALVGVLILAPLGLAEVLQGLVEAERYRPGVQAAERRLAALATLGEAGTERDTQSSNTQSSNTQSSNTQSSNTQSLRTLGHTRRIGGPSLRLDELAVGWGAEPVAEGLNLDLAAGEIALVTGPSGSGKSTLAATLLGLIRPLNGGITIGGQALDDCTGTYQTGLATGIGLLAQDETIFDTTIRENLRIANPDVDEPTLRRALDRVGLLGMVDALAAGLDAEVGEAGSKLSGGERQRLALARLLLADHDILILDEPTEHLDEPSAQALLRVISSLAGAHSLLIITHSSGVLQHFAGSQQLHVTPAQQHRSLVWPG